MEQKKSNSTLLLASVSIGLFVVATRTRQPIIMAVAAIAVIITYIRFRKNYITYRQTQAKLKRRSGSIDVTASETRESEDQNV